MSQLTSSQFPELRQQILRAKHFTSQETQQNALRDLIHRLLPDHHGLFTFSVDFTAFEDPALDTAHITSSNGTVHILGNSGTACAFGLYHFLKYHLGMHVSWSARQLSFPSTLPDVSVTIKKADLLHYYLNVCTSSYSFVWWDWARWEQEIDWMALQGINFPLAITGQEEIWRRVYTKLGLTEEELDKFFVGPAFLAWSRMGNIRTWAGPLPREWMTEQVALQHRILERMQSFGMIPILPAFNGIVPVSIGRLFPGINLTRMTTWNSFPDDMTGSYFLEPSEKLFGELGKSFIREMASEYNYTSGFYNVDTFNEQKPRDRDDWNADFIRDTVAVTYAAMLKADPNAIWVMQAWMLYYDAHFWTPERTTALLTAIPVGRLIMLDLYAEVHPTFGSTNSFHGQPFIWCMLHNFGGVSGLYGRLSPISTGPLAGRSYPNSSMVGVGIATEGTNQNAALYELMNEMAWRTETPDVTQWVGDYASRRYGSPSQYAQDAYLALRKSVWECNVTVPDSGHYTITRRPRFGFIELLWYDPDQVILALDLLLKQSTDMKPEGIPSVLYDIVDVSRQVLQVIFTYFYQQLCQAHTQKKIDSFKLYGKVMEMILTDMEAILSLHPGFQLKPWVEAAKSWARNDQQKELFRWNALNQISIWGPDGQIVDYATKQWSGVVGGYFHPRWSLFLREVVSSMEKGERFNQNAFDLKVFQKVELPFTHSDSSEGSVNTEVPVFESIVDKAREIYGIYRSYRTLQFLDAFSPRNNDKSQLVDLRVNKDC